MRFVDRIPNCSNVADGQAYVQLGCDSCLDGYTVAMRDGSDEYQKAMQVAREVGSYREVWKDGEDGRGLNACDDGFCDRLGRLADGRRRLESVSRFSISTNRISSISVKEPVAPPVPDINSKQNRVLHSVPYERPPATKAEAAEVAMIVVRGGRKVVITRGNPEKFSV